MAADSDLEKTEPASPRRLYKAREEGNVPRSRELAACASLVTGGALLWLLGGSLESGLAMMLRDGLSIPRELAFDPAALLDHGSRMVGRVLWLLLPFSAVLLAVILVAPVMVGGWLFTWSALQPRFQRLDPVAGLGRLLSTNALAELGKAIAKTALVGLSGWFVIRSETETVLSLAALPVDSAAQALGQLLMMAFVPMAGTLALIAIVDVPWQRWQHEKKLRMTREEVRQEHKEQEGNPEIKGRIRAQQRAMARQRMMAEVPKADVVVTNPTHYAVALRYSETEHAAPVVLAKGADDIAAKIRAIAADHRIPLLEAPPLARALYRHTEPGDVIPERLYTAVAQVLAYVFQLHAGADPSLPDTLDVPADMDSAARAPEQRA